MKSFFFSIGCILILIYSANLAVFQPQPSENTLQKITFKFHEGMSNLEFQIISYIQQAEALKANPQSIEILQKVHLNTRLAYKRIELFLEYFDREGIKKYINGAPLPRLEPHVPEIRIIEPSGLQVLDELVFSENPFTEKEEIIKQTKSLQKKYSEIQIYQKGIQIQHRYVFEASRQELIRIFTLGVTGFDTPGSTNALPEAMQSIAGIDDAISPYFSLLNRLNPPLQKELARLLSEAGKYLNNHQNFDAFNRLEFLKEYINPLFSILLDAQNILAIETIEETTHRAQPTNFEARNIFSDDFLNPYYFANITPKYLTKKRVELGKLLFFDPVLSKNNQRSCASCHQPDKAFTDGLDKSLAIDGKGKIGRNAPTLINAVYAERFFHDLREIDLERQIKHVILDSLEFNTDFLEIIEKLNKSDEYQKLFAEAYKDQPDYILSKWSVSNALASYILSLRSFNSPFDRFVRGESSFLAQKAINGFNLFMGKAACGTCHFAPTFNGTVPPVYEESESEVLGVPMTIDQENPVIDPDPGRIGSYRPQDEAFFYTFSFKTPTVRNIALTAPYMHNGVYSTLEEVIDFYNKGGGIGLGLDLPHQTLPGTPLELTDSEMSDLVAFMNTLTDTTGLTSIPEKLPIFERNPSWNQRVAGGNY